MRVHKLMVCMCTLMHAFMHAHAHTTAQVGTDVTVNGFFGPLGAILTAFVRVLVDHCLPFYVSNKQNYLKNRKHQTIGRL